MNYQNVSVLSIGLSRRVKNVLYRGGIRDLQTLINTPTEKLLTIIGIGAKGVDEIGNLLASYKDLVVNSDHDVTLPSELPDPIDRTVDQKSFRNLSVLSVGLSRRTSNALCRGGILDLQTLAETPTEKLLSIHGIGVTAIGEITTLLDSFEELVLHASLVPTVVSETPDPAVLREFFSPEQSVMDLLVSMRVRRSLYNAGIRTIADLLSVTWHDLARLRGLGETSLRELGTYFLSVRVNEIEDGDKLIDDNLSVVSQSKSELDLSQISEKDVFASLMLGVDERNTAIIAYRFGLGGNEVHTLQETGEKFGITRERVRQICINNIRIRVRRNTMHNSLLRRIRASCEKYVRNARVTTIGRLITYISSVTSIQDTDQLSRLLVFINDDVLDDQYRFASAVDRYLICAPEFDPDYVLSVFLAIRNYIHINMAPMSLDRLLEFSHSEFRNNPPDEQLLLTVLEDHPDFVQTESGDWSLPKWQKRTHDDLVIVLRELGRPAHFTELARLVNERLSHDAQVSDHSIHNQLMRYTNLFIRTDSGTFALREQFPDAPVQPPKYVDLIEEVLEEVGRPLDVSTVHERVSLTREAKSASIMIYLGTHERFTSYGGGLYGLARWRHDERTLNERGELIFSYCPPPLLPSRGSARIFFDSILVGRRLLTENPRMLPRQFYAEMLSWAEQAPTRERDVQSAFDAWYAAGLIQPVNLSDSTLQPLELMIASEMKLNQVRMYSIGSICRRIIKTSELLAVLDRIPNVDTKTLKDITFNGTSDGFDLPLRLNMLAAFEAIRADGSSWRITDLGRAALRANPPQELPDFSVIESLEPDEPETDDWDDHLTIFTL